MPASAPPVSPPTTFYVPEGARFTIADEIADLATAVGYQIEESERLALHALYPQARDGSWIGLESGIVCPRQNMKTALMLAGSLHDTFVQGVERVVWTAHEFKTSSDAFRDLRTIIEGHDWLASEVRAIRTANGAEGFDLRNGSRLDIVARTGKSGRGMGSPRLYLDEALYLEAKMVGAIVPVVSARPNAHIVYGSSPGVPASAHLRELRTRGRSGADPYLGWIEWSQDRGTCGTENCAHIPGTPGCWLDDMDAVVAVNPAAGRRISMEYLTQERLTLASAPVEYLRERMGVWEDPPFEGEGLAFPADEFAACLDESSFIPDGAHLVFAVDVSWDRTRASIGVAGLREDGTTRHVQVVGVMDPSEVRDWLLSRQRRFRPLAVALQGVGAPASSLAVDLSGAGLPVHLLNGGDIAKSCGSMLDSIRSRRITHLGAPDLHQQVATAPARPLGDGFALDRKKAPVDISGLVAITEALWVLDELIGSAGYDLGSSIH